MGKIYRTPSQLIFGCSHGLCFILECCILLWEINSCSSVFWQKTCQIRPKICCHFSAMRKKPSGKFRGWRILVFYLALRAAIQVLKTLCGLEQIDFPKNCAFFVMFLEVHVHTSIFGTALCALCFDTRGSLYARGQHFVPPFTSHRHPAKAKASASSPFGSLRWRLRLAPRNCCV